MDTPSASTLLKSLRGRICPACGDAKGAAKSLCFRCYRRLSGRERADLYRLIGDGYDAAMVAALKSLGVRSPRWVEPAGGGA